MGVFESYSELPGSLKVWHLLASCNLTVKFLSIFITDCILEFSTYGAIFILIVLLILSSD